MGIFATRINGELDKSFRQLCKQRGLTISQCLNELVKEAVNDDLSEDILPEEKDIKPEVNTMLKSVDTTEEKFEKVRQMKLEITKLVAKQGSGESGHFSDLFPFFYDETLQGLIAKLRSDHDILLQEIESDRQAWQVYKDQYGEVKHEV